MRDWIFLSYQTLDLEDAWESMVFNRCVGAEGHNAVEHLRHQIQIRIQQSRLSPVVRIIQEKDLIVIVRSELFSDKFSVYILHDSSDFTAEELVLALVQSGIIGFPIRSGLHT